MHNLKLGQLSFLVLAFVMVALSGCGDDKHSFTTLNEQLGPEQPGEVVPPPPGGGGPGDPGNPGTPGTPGGGNTPGSGDPDEDDGDDHDGHDGGECNRPEVCRPGKLRICHVPPGNPGNAHAICVSMRSARRGHGHHYDYLGECK